MKVVDQKLLSKSYQTKTYWPPCYGA